MQKRIRDDEEFSHHQRIISSVHRKKHLIENDFTIEDLIIEEANSLEKNDDSNIAFVVFITSSASRVASISITSRSTRKRHDSLLNDED
jgi:hypothetical protein